MHLIANRHGAFLAASSEFATVEKVGLGSGVYRPDLGLTAAFTGARQPNTAWKRDTAVITANIEPAVLKFCKEHGVEVSAYRQMETYAHEVMAAFCVAATTTRREIACLEGDEICMLIISVEQDVDTVADLNFALCGKMAATESIPSNMHAMFEAL